MTLDEQDQAIERVREAVGTLAPLAQLTVVASVASTIKGMSETTAVLEMFPGAVAAYTRALHEATRAKLRAMGEGL